MNTCFVCQKSSQGTHLQCKRVLRSYAVLVPLAVKLLLLGIRHLCSQEDEDGRAGNTTAHSPFGELSNTGTLRLF